ncbi:CPBP family intramembrane metalloprotease domain-containing protein, partial [Leptolyngbya sp. FACHB-36]|nr:CPBP family intramembrane metalloprotease domain-containing protein [Leptolyngbya sp. FACHB-36]
SIDTAQLMRYTDRGPAWMTGLAGQPLAGVVGLLLLLVTAGVLWGASLA